MAITLKGAIGKYSDVIEKTITSESFSIAPFDVITICF